MCQFSFASNFGASVWIASSKAAQWRRADWSIPNPQHQLSNQPSEAEFKIYAIGFDKHSDFRHEVFGSGSGLHQSLSMRTLTNQSETAFLVQLSIMIVISAEECIIVWCHEGGEGSFYSRNPRRPIDGEL